MSRFKDDPPDGTQQSTSRPPLLKDVLTEIAQSAINSNYRLHEMMPGTAQGIAAWWPTQQEQPTRFDTPTLGNKKSGDGKYWRTPYIDRVGATLRQFFAAPEHFQTLILAAAEDNIFWRGEDIESFGVVIRETEQMRKIGVAEYRKQAMQKMKSAFASLVTL